LAATAHPAPDRHYSLINGLVKCILIFSAALRIGKMSV
jgi:hypothetical protein